MKEIGNIIREERINQNRSIEDISNITKMNINIVENIEAGNLDYFKNDLFYLRYYVKSYLSALDLEIENIDAILNDATLEYTQAIDLIEAEKLKNINEQIKTKQISISNMNQGKLSGINQGKNRVKRIDWTLVSLISVVALISLFLVYSLVNSYINGPVVDDTPPPIVDKPDDKENPVDKEEEPDEKPIEIAKVEVKNLEVNNLELTNWNNETRIIAKFNVPTWTQITVNNQIVSIPDTEESSRTYQANEELAIGDKYKLNGAEVEFKEGDVISIRFGIMNGNEFLINEDKLELDDSIATALGGTNLTFTLGKKAD